MENTNVVMATTPFAEHIFAQLSRAISHQTERLRVSPNDQEQALPHITISQPASGHLAIVSVTINT